MNRMKSNHVYLVVFIISIFTQIAYGQFENDDLILFQGKVKSIKEVSYKAVLKNDSLIKTNKEWEAKSRNDQLFIINQNGNLIQRKQLDNNSVIRVDEFKYIDNKIHQSDMLYNTKTYSYDSNNRVISVIILNRHPSSISAKNADNISTERYKKHVHHYKNDKLVYTEIVDEHEQKKGVINYTHTR